MYGTDDAPITDAKSIVNAFSRELGEGHAPVVRPVHMAPQTSRRPPAVACRNLLNPPGYSAFSSRIQPPPTTLHNVAVSVQTPAGAKLLRTFEVSPGPVRGADSIAQFRRCGNGKTIVPTLRTWSVIVFEYGPAQGTVLSYPAFKLATPIEDSTAYAKTLPVLKNSRHFRRSSTSEKLNGASSATPTTSTVSNPHRLPRPSPQKQTPFFEVFDHAYNAGRNPPPKALKPPTDMEPSGATACWTSTTPRGRSAGTTPSNLRWVSPAASATPVPTSPREGLPKLRARLHAGFLDTFPELLKCDVLVLDNVLGIDLGPARRAMIAEYVKNGGSLLIIGGIYNMSGGMDRKCRPG